jgi:hypothetical protein
MSCLATRQRFADFWRRSLAGDDRAAFLTHLAECSICEHAFRTFALAAPLLHSGPKQAAAEGRSTAVTEPPDGSAVRATTVGASRLRPLLGVSLALVIVVSLAAYLAQPPQVTFRDLIVEYCGANHSSYGVTDDLLGPDQPACGLNQPTSEQAAPKPEDQHHLAG